ncbi:MAG: hypothetical protein AB3N22_03705 [Ruegeria sp.]
MISTSTTTVVVEDTDGTKSWTSIASTYDAAGFLVAKVTYLDSGSTISETFFGPQRLSQTITDTSADAQPWASRTTEWTWLGQKTTRTTVDDDGDTLIERYDVDSGKRIERVDVDSTDSHKWHCFSTLYDATGKDRIGTEKVFDDGRVDTRTYDADTGTMTARTIQDGADKFVWTTRTLTYDADTGRKTGRDILYDDGSRDTLVLQEGKRVSHTRFDGDDDAFEWVTLEKTYDSNGRLAQVEETRDDSDLIIRHFAGGELVGRTRYDNSGNEAWHVEQVTFDASGNVTETLHFDDSGTLLLL